MKTEILNICDELLGATFNGLWQGTLITILVAIGLRLFGPMNAATRHAVWLMTLLLCVWMIPAQFLRKGLPSREPALIDLSPQNTAAGQAVEFIQVSPAWVTPAQEPISAYSDFVQDELTCEADNPAALSGVSDGELQALLSESEKLLPEAASVMIVKNHGKGMRPYNAGLPSIEGSTLKPPSPEKPNQESVANGKQPFAGFNWSMPSRIQIPRVVSFLLLSAWLSIAVTRLVMLGYQLLLVRKLKREGSPASSALSDIFQSLRDKLGIRRNVDLRISRKNYSPALLGFVHPVITLPQNEFAADNLPDAEKILCHELAHVRRYDDWANLLQNIIQAVVFFHPAVPWISRRLSLEREIACDDYVLQGGKPKSYALLLASLADRFQGNRALPAPGVTTTRSQLHQRINMILNTHRNISPRLAKARLGLVTTTAAALAALAIYCGPRVVLAQNSADNEFRSGASAGNRITAPPAALPTPEPAVVVEVAPRTPTADPTPGSADAGPRFKPEVATATTAPRRVSTEIAAVPPAVVTIPAPPGTPSTDVVAIQVPPPPGYGAPQAVIVGRKTRTIDAETAKSLEARLERVERMLQELLAQRHGGDIPGHGALAKSGDDVGRDAQEMAMLHKKKAEMDAMHAQKDAERAEKDSRRDSKMKLKAGTKDAKLQKEACSRALEALQRSREQLERQMEKLDQQIEKLEQEQESAEEDQQASEDEDDSKQEN